MARWLGIDHGTRRIGVAVGDAGGAVVSPVEQLRGWPGVKGRFDPIERIAKLAAEYGVSGVVVGWPLLTDGSEGSQAGLARRFAVDLAGRTGLDVRLWDERLSSFEADERLKGNFTRNQKRRRHDAVAASTILEDFLAADGPAAAPRASELRNGGKFQG